MPTAFLSYAKEDAGHARRLYSSLLDNGIDVWFDEVSLLPGQKWKDEIERSISGCRYFIAMTSVNSLSKTGYVQKELKTALEILDLHPTNQIYVIPIRIEECRIEDRKLKEIHYVDFFPDCEFGLPKLLKAIGLTSSTASREPQSQQTLEDVAASPAQIDAAKHFFDGISAKRKEIQQRDKEQTAAKASQLQKLQALLSLTGQRAGEMIAAYNTAAGRHIVSIQVSGAALNIAPIRF